ncbi:hypothetical protein LZ31DRAFT_158915 [Colletotrichum somersetense]|nr:hypothetical protein LZ31DRAFT_158915 [Colletotrichum somersetense]
MSRLGENGESCCSGGCSSYNEVLSDGQPLCLRLAEWELGRCDSRRAKCQLNTSQRAMASWMDGTSSNDIPSASLSHWARGHHRATDGWCPSFRKSPFWGVAEDEWHLNVNPVSFIGPDWCESSRQVCAVTPLASRDDYCRESFPPCHLVGSTSPCQREQVKQTT